MSIAEPTVSSWPSLPFVDVTAPGFAWESAEVAEARERQWAARTPVGLMVLRYAEMAELARDPRIISDIRQVAERAGITGGPAYDPYDMSLMSRNGEGHRRLRRLVNPAFTPRRIAEQRAYIRATAQRLTEDLVARLTVDKACDMVDAFAEPFAMTATARLLGIGYEDYENCRRWIDVFGRAHSLDTDSGLAPYLKEAADELLKHIDTLIAERRTHLGEDLLSDLIRAQQDGVLDEHESRVLFLDVMVAGLHTTVHQFGQALVAFAHHPQQWRLLQKRPELAEQAVEEVLRWCPIAPLFLWRYAAEDLTFHDVHVPAGTPVWLCAYSANRDPRVFADGDTFDITTQRDAPPLLFGGGPHHCPGAVPARAELAEALTALTTRLGPPQIVEPINRRSPAGVTGPDALSMRFAPLEDH